MTDAPIMLFDLAEALGIGLLIGAEREQRVSHSEVKASAGIRTFAVSALLGAVAQMSGGSVAKNPVMGERALVIFGEISDERFQVAPLSG